ncbi:MAG: glycoside hydrolase family 3 N-terminal domain-containing protein [Verrucomicrobiales bacterium]|nr:glycoside hydrolase family 3 N-terminal domain-containing protein [Verrucomicrobiales bacterium]
MPNKSFLTFLLIINFSLTVWSADSSSQPDISLLQKPATLAQAEIQARKLMESMTLEERFDFVCGNGFGVRAVPRLGIPELRFADASCGLRLPADDPGTNKTTAFSCTLLLAATWDTDLAREYAQAIAEEFRADGRHFILGPGMNLYRTSKGGRNFEFMGEDPFLAGELVAAYVRGAQSVNVATTLKHFIGNETENHRRAANAIIDERTLHEIYMAPFKSGIDAGAWAVMTAYNPLNGAWTGESKYVGTELLRQELGFPYLIMTDWVSVWHGDKVVQSGTDLVEPDGVILKLDRDKIFGTPDIDGMVVNILKTGIASGLYELEARGEFKQPAWVDKYPAHEQLARRVNAAGIVLLANNGLLPLESVPKGKILVSGNAATLKELSGGGSGHVVGYHNDTYLQAVQRTFGQTNVVYLASPADADIQAAGMVLLFTGRPPNVNKSLGEAEGINHPFELPEDALIARCTRLNQRTVVNLTCGGGAQMDWADRAAAIVMAFYGGQTGPDALMDVLTGKTNPAGKLPFTIEKQFEDSCAAGDDELVKPGAILVDPQDFARRVKASREKPLVDFLTRNDDNGFYTYDLNYKEGIQVGYRWYDAKKIKPRFPFGFGLSYTKFSYRNLKLSTPRLTPDASVTVSVKVRNTGQRAGSEAVQLYLRDLNPKIEKSVRELKGFAKVALQPGETKTVDFILQPRDLAYFDVPGRQWKADAGKYEIEVGASSRAIKQKTALQLTAPFTTKSPSQQ